MEGAMGGEGLEQVPREGSSGEVEAGRQVLSFGLGGEGGGGEEDGEVNGALGDGGTDNEGEEGELGETKGVGRGGGFDGGGGGGGGGGRGCEAEEGNVLRVFEGGGEIIYNCLLYTSPSPRDLSTSRMPSSA